MAETLPFVRCDCPNGENRTGRPTCYHSAAVIILLTEDPEDIPEDNEVDISATK